MVPLEVRELPEFTGDEQARYLEVRNNILKHWHASPTVQLTKARVIENIHAKHHKSVDRVFNFLERYLFFLFYFNFYYLFNLILFPFILWFDLLYYLFIYLSECTFGYINMGRFERSEFKVSETNQSADMASVRKKTIVIVGAGMAGLAAARQLDFLGYHLHSHLLHYCHFYHTRLRNTIAHFTLLIKYLTRHQISGGCT
jgi:hypothetical protein